MGESHKEILSEISKEIWEYLLLLLLLLFYLSSYQRFWIKKPISSHGPWRPKTDGNQNCRFFPGSLQCKVDTSHKYLCISSLPSNALLYFLESTLIQQGWGSISNVTETPKDKEECFSTLQPNWESFDANNFRFTQDAIQPVLGKAEILRNAKFIGNKAKERISKWILQENKAH